MGRPSSPQVPPDQPSGWPPRAWKFLAARLEPRTYLGLHLTLGFLLSAATLWVFAAITEEVLEPSATVRRDLAVAAWFHAHATALGDRIFVAISLVGSPVTMGALGIVVAVILWRRGERVLLAGWIAALVGGTVLDALLKLVIRRPRPEFAMQFLHGQTWSFPSGHAMGSVIGYGMLAYVLTRLGHIERRGARALLWAAAIALALTIGFSRLYLTVHYLSDVVGGLIAGALWLAVCVTGLDLVRRRAEFHRAAANAAGETHRA